MNEQKFLKERCKNIRKRTGINIDIPVKFINTKKTFSAEYNVEDDPNNPTIFINEKQKLTTNKWIETLILHEYTHHCIRINYKKNKYYLKNEMKYINLYMNYVKRIIYNNKSNKNIGWYNTFEETPERIQKIRRYKMNNYSTDSLTTINEFIASNVDYWYYFDMDKNKFNKKVYEMVTETVKLMKN